MLESIQDLLYQKEKAETVSFDSKKTDEVIFKKPKPLKKLNKKDISAPCNFKHVSGQHDQDVCVCVWHMWPMRCRSVHLSTLQLQARLRSA